MKISLKWLCDHIDVSDMTSQPMELAQKLTAVGLEVEAVEDRASAFHHVVVGQVVKLEQHPNADRLTVCQVDAGEGQPRQIVCGARNHKQGDKVVVTLPGAVLPGNFEIKKSKIRDVESLGMLASESELGLKDTSEGILILPPDAPVGRPIAEYMGWDDVIFEINVTPNRADCLSHLGLARELSALLNRPLKSPGETLPTSANVSTASTVHVEVKAPQLCSRYAGRVIRGIKVGPSPAWLKARLESVGVNSINNVVDVTNFIMMDLGQPLHAFDVAKLQGASIIVDKAQVGEKFKTLDGTELTLIGDELTIRDRERAVCLAGVVGGSNSGVSESTTTVFVESAHFALDSVRKTARRHGLQTDSAYRFSRGTDPSGVVYALDRACTWIQKIAGGEVAADAVDLRASKTTRTPIAISAKFVAQKLGYAVNVTDLSAWLKRLGCDVKATADDALLVTPPEYRGDLEQDVDLVEEYGRLNGYTQIPETLPSLSYAPLDNDKGYVFEQRVADLARRAGFSRAVNYGFVGSKFQTDVLGSVDLYRGCGLDMDTAPIALRNPLSEEMDVMRVSLLPGLMHNLLHNIRHGLLVGRVFETGFVFRRGPEGYEQDGRLAVVAWGMPQGLWAKSQAPVFYDVKSRLQVMLEKLSITQVQWNPWTNAASLVHPGQSAILNVEGRAIGFVGTLHPKWTQAEKLRVEVAVGEIDLKALSRGQPRVIKFKPVSKFPAVERDLAFVLPLSLKSQDVAAEIKRTVGPLLQSVEVFDVFRGESLPPEHVSVAYRMVLQDMKETLSMERLTQLQEQIVANVEKKFSVKVR